MFFKAKKFRVYYSKDSAKALAKKGKKRDFQDLETAEGWAEAEYFSGNTAIILDRKTNRILKTYKPNF